MAAPGRSIEEVLARKASRNEGAGLMRSASKLLESGMTREVSVAIERGVTHSDKKAAWVFDTYQASDYYPVDYRYWTTSYSTDTAKTELLMMQANIWTPDYCELATDGIQMKNKLSCTHMETLKDFYHATGVNLNPLKQYQAPTSFRSDWQNMLLEAQARADAQQDEIRGGSVSHDNSEQESSQES